MKARVLEVLLVAAVVVAGILAYRAVVRPDPDVVARLAQAKLREIFGPGVETDRVAIDLVDGVTIEGLRVRTPSTTEPTLSAARVVVRHDLVALSAGSYRPTEIEIRDARIVTHETEAGIELDFPFHLDEPGRGDEPLKLSVKDSSVLFRSMPGSKRLQEGFVARLTDVDLEVEPNGTIATVRGALSTLGFGPENDAVRILLRGSADLASERVFLEVIWDPIHLTEYVLEHVLADEIAGQLRGKPLERGRLVVTVEGDPSVQDGALRVRATWTGDVRMDLAEIPGVRDIDAKTREQIAALLGTTALKVEITEEGIDVSGLAEALGGAKVSAHGKVEDDGEAFRLDIEVHDLRIEDPSVRKALGEAGAKLFDQFQPRGQVDAAMHVEKARGEDPKFDVIARLEDASFKFVGPPPGPEGLEGFPYPVVQATGQIRITPNLVRIEDLQGVGRNGVTRVRIRGAGQEAWTGGPTGTIRFTDEGTEVRITIEASRVPVDRDLRAAVAGSEFADIFDSLSVSGEIDRVEVDVISVPGKDQKAYAEARLTLDGERFRYLPFPLDLEDVKGQVTARRPHLEGGGRGEVFAFDVTGRADGAAVRAKGEVRAHEKGGRVNVTGEHVPLGGGVTRAILESEAGRGALGELWKFLEPRGHASVELDFPVADDPEPVHVRVDLEGASVRLDAACSPNPMEVTGLTGRILVDGELARVLDVKGTMIGVPVTVSGTLEGGPAGRWDLTVETGTLRLVPEVLAEMERLTAGAGALPPGWKIEPGGRMALTIRFCKEPGPGTLPCTEVRATNLDASLRMPNGMTVTVRGELLHAGPEGMRLEQVEVEAPGARVSVPEAQLEGDTIVGTFRFFLEDFAVTPEVLSVFQGDLKEDLDGLVGGRLLTSKDFEVRADPDGAIHLQGEVAIRAREDDKRKEGLRGRLAFESFGLSADGPDGRTSGGTVRLQDVTYDAGIALDGMTGTLVIHDLRLGDDPEGRVELASITGKVAGVTVADMTAPVVWKEGILVADPIVGTLARGRVTGWLRAHTRAPGAYEGSFRVDRFDLAALRDDLFPTGPPYSGIGNACVRFQNRGEGVKDLTADGVVNVREGNLGDLPVVANIFALAGGVLSVKDPPKFEKLHVQFSLRNETIHFDELELSGPLFEMPGRGTVDLSGYADLTFSPNFLKSLLLPGVQELPGVGEVLRGAFNEEILYAVRVRGDLETAEPEIVLLPAFGGGGRKWEGTGMPEIPDRPLPRWFR